MLPVSGRPSKGWRAEEAGEVLRQNAFVGLNMKLTRKAVASLTLLFTKQLRVGDGVSEGWVWSAGSL